MAFRSSTAAKAPARASTGPVAPHRPARSASATSATSAIPERPNPASLEGLFDARARDEPRGIAALTYVAELGPSKTPLSIRFKRSDEEAVLRDVVDRSGAFEKMKIVDVSVDVSLDGRSLFPPNTESELRVRRRASVSSTGPIGFAPGFLETSDSGNEWSFHSGRMQLLDKRGHEATEIEIAFDSARNPEQVVVRNLSRSLLDQLLGRRGRVLDEECADLKKSAQRAKPAESIRLKAWGTARGASRFW